MDLANFLCIFSDNNLKNLKNYIIKDKNFIKLMHDLTNIRKVNEIKKGNSNFVINGEYNDSIINIDN
jgi:hypothetical protein